MCIYRESESERERDGEKERKRKGEREKEREREREKKRERETAREGERSICVQSMMHIKNTEISAYNEFLKKYRSLL